MCSWDQAFTDVWDTIYLLCLIQMLVREVFMWPVSMLVGERCRRVMERIPFQIERFDLKATVFQ
jgi:hypothetical protein